MRMRMLPLAGTIVCTYLCLISGAVAGPSGPQAANKEGSNASAAADEAQIRELLNAQAADWNRGDINSFMTSYWRSDQTTFVGASGIARGWQAVLDRYHRTYPDRESMGHVTFSKVEVHLDCADSAYVIGQYQLQRANDHPAGVFTLNLHKFAEGWRIVVDHTTAFPVQPSTSK